MVPPTDAPTPSGGAQVGSSIAGRYRLVRPLATGGMARVWEGFDEVLGRPVAVKVLHEHLAADPTFLARFRREAISAAGLSHPCIVSIYDTCSDGGTEAIVMELVRGTDLRRHLDEHGPLPIEEVVRIGRAVAAALAHAHAAGLVHRDVKPGNVLLAEDDRVLVADFGIAKAGEGADLTAEATMLGTAKYLAPEQVRGEPVDARSDVYGLGTVLYEALTGSVPFRGDSEAATALLRLQEDPPPLRDRRSDVPWALADVVMRALARRPEDRWPTATALREALGAAASGAAVPVTGTVPVAGATALTTIAAPSPTAGLAGPQPPGTAAVPVRAPEAATRGWSNPSAPPPPSAPATTASSAPPSHPGTATPPRRRRWGPVAVGALVLSAAAVLALLVTTLSGDGSGAVQIVTAHAFDPAGDQSEHDDQAHLAIDGDLETAWTTETYTDPDVTRLKPGVGLVLDLDRTVTVGEVTVSSSTRGWDAEVYAVDGSAPGSLAGWGRPLDVASGGGGDDTTLTVDRTANRVLLWFTRVGDDGVTRIEEVTVE